jgi:hypothetical protein
MLRLPRMFRSIENPVTTGSIFSDNGFPYWGAGVSRFLTGSSFQLGLVGFIGQVPLLFLSPIGGLHK